MSGKLYVEIFSEKDNDWNILNECDWDSSVQNSEERNIAILKRHKEKWFFTLHHERQMRIVSETSEKGQIIRRVVG